MHAGAVSDGNALAFRDMSRGIRMTQAQIAQDYDRWLDRAVKCSRSELEALAVDEAALEDAFYRDLAFGTGGLRGVLGPGPNRMNVYTVAKATQGLADHLNAHFENPSVAIARDSRLNGELFMRVAAEVLAANGIRVHLYPRIEPTPALSFAVRDLGCAAGICLTASHNPAEYNGYKVYGPDGCQITTQAAASIQEAINAVDMFDDVKRTAFHDALADGDVSWIGEDTLARYIEAVAAQTLEPADDARGNGGITVVYTPLNGSGLECVERISRVAGISKLTIVPEQAVPDGRFPTCPYPNPEVREALQRGLELSQRMQPDLLLATDPDADRVGVAVPNAKGEFELITGNEMGILLLDYICKIRAARGENLEDKVVVTTIVSAPMADALSDHYGFELRRTLTGFKFIGEQIGLLEHAGEADRFIFGFEESYGYLSGAYVRDKDAIDASMLICQMVRHYKMQGLGLLEVLEKLYERFGFFCTGQVSVAYPGAEGAQQMQGILSKLREHEPRDIAGFAVSRALDYSDGIEMPVHGCCKEAAHQMLSPSNVLEYRLQDSGKIIIRPSGTEPKIKAYLFAHGGSAQHAGETLDVLKAAVQDILG